MTESEITERIAARSNAKKAARKAFLEDIGSMRTEALEYARAYGLHYVHVRPSLDPDFPIGKPYALPKGGCTLAWARCSGDCVDVAIANVHPNDHYFKLMGRLISGRRFDEGQYITIRIPRREKPSQFLAEMFRLTVE